jgi:hypothetical protein
MERNAAISNNGIVFADDHSYGDDDEEAMTNAANTIERSCRESGVSLDINKRTDTCFKRKSAGSQETRVTGIILDSHLSMNAHTRELIKQTRPRMAQLLLARVFLDRETVATVYKTFILPILENGNAVIEAIATEAEKAKLDKLHRSCCGIQMDCLSLRRRVSIYCFLYKAVVLKVSPKPLMDCWKKAAAAETRSSSRLAGSRNHWPVDIPVNADDFAMTRRYAKAMEGYNLLPAQLFVDAISGQQASLQAFKSKVAKHLREALIFYGSFVM